MTLFQRANGKSRSFEKINITLLTKLVKVGFVFLSLSKKVFEMKYTCSCFCHLLVMYLENTYMKSIQYQYDAS